MLRRSFQIGISVFVGLAFAGTGFSGDAKSPQAIFESRILPIFKSPNPSSCIQCHLASVDLKNYILPDAKATFRSLRDQGLIDLENPTRSKILALIDRGGAAEKGPALLHAKSRKMEREAFEAWIFACASDPKMRELPRLDATEFAKPAVSDEVIRHGRIDRVLASFETNVWAWRFRCMSCHIEGTSQNDKLRAEHGNRVAWIKKGGAQATLEYLLESRLVDAENPERSLLLRKPLGEKHGGGKKFIEGDQGYQGFRIWLEDAAAIRTNKYVKSTDLPAPAVGPLKFGTDIWFRLSDIPAAWGDKLLRVQIYAWNRETQAWETDPIATTDRLANAKFGWQHNLTLLAANASARANAWTQGIPTLPAGKYLAKVYVDQTGRAAKDWKSPMAESDFVGTVEFQANWRPGYGAMTVVLAKGVQR